jgi:hypothetical protein
MASPSIPSSLYQPLDTSASEIRLLTIIPSDNPPSEVTCKLTTASLDNPPYYVALSYAWGDESLVRPITVNNQRCLVTASLELALRRIRRLPGKRGRPQILWADAVCINQGDIPEKSTQVLLMGRIYSEAPRVMVWLGEEVSEELRLAVHWTLRPVSIARIKAKMLSLFNSKASVKRLTTLTKIAHGIHELRRHRYWSRIWTFQEYLLPRAEPLLLCGDLPPFYHWPEKKAEEYLDDILDKWISTFTIYLLRGVEELEVKKTCGDIRAATSHDI